MTEKTLYEILGVNPAATSSGIKTAYRLLAMKSHPALQKGIEASEQFARVSGAFATLSDAEKRRRYDDQLAGGTKAGSGFFEQITLVQAERMFAKEMSALAWELAEAGYDHTFIERALTEKGCPVAIAVVAAKGTVLAGGDGNVPKAGVALGGASSRPERALDGSNNALAHARSASFRTLWFLAGAAVIGCFLIYSLAYRPYVTAKEEKIKRLVAERVLAAATASKEEAERIAAEEKSKRLVAESELAAATAAKMEAEASARAEEQARIQQSVRQQARVAARAQEDHQPQQASERQQASGAAEPQAEYQACLARLAPAPQSPQAGATHPLVTSTQRLDSVTGAIARFKMEQYENNRAAKAADRRIRGEAVCQELLRR